MGEYWESSENCVLLALPGTKNKSTSGPGTPYSQRSAQGRHVAAILFLVWLFKIRIYCVFDLRSKQDQGSHRHSFDTNFDARQMCVKLVMACLYIWSMSPHVRSNQMSHGFTIHSLPVRGGGKFINTFDSNFDFRERRSKTPCIPVFAKKLGCETSKDKMASTYNSLLLLTLPNIQEPISASCAAAYLLFQQDTYYVYTLRRLFPLHFP